MTFQRLVLIATAVLALVFSAAVTAGKGGGGQGGMAGMGGVDAPKALSKDQTRVRSGEQEGYTYRFEGDPVAGPKGGSESGKGGKGGGGKDPQINPLRE